MPALIQPSFAKGEIGPHLYGRVDTAAYQVALRSARNCVVHPWGGVSNRPGTYFIAPCRTHQAGSRLIPFQFKTTDSYVLAFTSDILRFIRNDALVTQVPKNITGITNALPGVVTVLAHGLSNFNTIFITGVVGMSNVNGRYFFVNNVTANTFELLTQDTLVNFNTVSLGAYVSGGTIQAVYEIAHPYTGVGELANVKYTQSGDVMTLTHTNYPPYELTRTGHTAWTMTPVSFGPGITFPTSINVAPTVAGAVTYRYKVTAVSRDTGEESLAGLCNVTRNITAATSASPAVLTSAAHGYSNGDEVQIDGIASTGWTVLDGARFQVTAVAANTFQIIDQNGVLVDSSAFGVYPGGGVAKQTDKRITNGAVTASNTVSWSSVTGAGTYNVYKFDNGTFGFIGVTTALQFLDDNIQANLARTPPASFNPFAVAGDYPQAVGYFEQRREFGGSNNAPDQTDYSGVGLQKNFNRSSPLQEDDAFTAVLAAGQVNEIRHYVSLNDLLVFTSGTEFKVNSGNDTAFSANTIRQKAQSSWGCSHLRPQVVGNTVIFVEDSKAKIRSMGFSFQIDGYTGVELSLLAPHLLETSPIFDWAFSNAPEPRLYMARADGAAMTMTFDQEQEVVAWTPWDTSGSYEGFCALRNPSLEASRENGVYMIVKRRVNGVTVRYIEKQASRVFQDIRDAYFVDCGLSIDNPIAITDIALGNPVTITSAAHGLTNGVEIDVSDIEWEPNVDDMFNETQPDQLNNGRYLVGNVTANTFNLFDSAGVAIDGTGFNVYQDGGNVRRTFQNVSGYDFLEGRKVSILADGNVISGKTILNGGLTLPQRVSRCHIGLSYISDIETLNIEASSGTIQGMLKSMAGAVFRFKQTRGVLVGPASDQLEQWDQREFEPFGAPTDQFSGDHEATFVPDWTTDGRCFIRQPYPLPVTLLAAVPKFEIGG